MAIPRKRGRVLTEAGKKKIADILVKHEINWRNRVSWIHDKISTTGDNLSKDTIRKILDLGSADLSSFETIFKGLEDKHEDGIDSVKDSQDTITNIPKSNSETSQKCPYRGLSPFRKEDAPFFFGREKFVETLVEAVQTQPFVAVVGNSGFGKSSVINAGLIPKLEESEIFKITTFRPQNNPFYKLANALIELFDPEMRERDKIIKIKENLEDFKQEDFELKDFLEYKLEVSDSEQRYLIFIDQFEELYTLCSDDETNIFIKQLFEAIDIESKKAKADIVVVITLRTDFLEQALPHPNLGKALA